MLQEHGRKRSSKANVPWSAIYIYIYIYMNFWVQPSAAWNLPSAQDSDRATKRLTWIEVLQRCEAIEKECMWVFSWHASCLLSRCRRKLSTRSTRLLKPACMLVLCHSGAAGCWASECHDGFCWICCPDGYGGPCGERCIYRQVQ